MKTRLAASIGHPKALKLYESFLLNILFTLNKGTFPFFLCFYPENSLESLKKWMGGDYLYMPQRGKDLGERMKNGFLGAFSMNFKRVVLIGSDIPGLPLELIEEAFASLRDKDMVIGPSLDGGYYLIGFRDQTFLPQVFEGIPWSTETVFEETMKVLSREGKTVHTLPPWRDIDTIEDLRNLPKGYTDPLPK